MTRSATERPRVVHQDQLTGLEDKAACPISPSFGPEPWIGEHVRRCRLRTAAIPADSALALDYFW
jgi:hypothetical protein